MILGSYNLSHPPDNVIREVLPDHDTILFIFNGESNSGGYALNTSPPTWEKAATNSVRILNNTTLLYEDLDIETNNLISHTGLTDNVTHGWELGLSLAARGGLFKGRTQVHLVKTGQGGSTISQWGTSDTYFTTMMVRVNAAKLLLNSQGKKFKIVYWFSHGINDDIAATPVATWKAGVKTHLNNLRTHIGAGPVMMTRLPAARTTYNASIDTLPAEVSDLFVINSSNYSLRDANHWDYDGMKSISQDMVYKTIDFFT